MSQPDYPDREQWPAYWRAIRRGVVFVVVVILVVLVALPLQGAADNHPWRFVLLVLIGGAVGVAVDALTGWIAKRWEGFLEGR